MQSERVKSAILVATALSVMLLTVALVVLRRAAPAGEGASSGERSVAADANWTPATGHEIAKEAIAAHVKFLADDLLEGRAPGSRGSQLASKYIAAAMEATGLEPAGTAGFFQRVPLVGLRPTLPKTVKFAAVNKEVAIAVPDELVVMPGHQVDHDAIDAAELVFAGYGIVAPEYQWDDYKDVDVRGKVVVVMNNDPERDPKLFAGKTRLWYGRWDYKYLQAAKKGAVGAIVIHTEPSAGYPWHVVVSSNSQEKFELPAGDEPRVAARMWMAEDAVRRVFAAGGKDLDALRASAEERGFRPSPLGVKVSLAWTTQIRSFESENIIGKVAGSDPKMKDEAVIFSAHHDHLGIGTPRDGDAIYNGAVDNASGVGTMLAIAQAAALSPHPKRSLLFLAVTAEEQGLLGSAFYCQNPTVLPGKIAANINIDSVNKIGRTQDLGYVGLGKSSLDDVVLAAARRQNRSVHGDPFPEKGGFYRSDQFSFAKIGVPAIYLHPGSLVEGHDAEWGRARAEQYEKNDYHQPSDQYDATWDLSGAVQDGELMLEAARNIANAEALPAWKPGDEFEAARKDALKAR